MSDDPAISLIEFDSIAAGMVAGDAMVKSSPLGSIYAGTIHPGKYLVLVSGDTASVEEALDKGLEIGGDAVVASVFLPDVHPAVPRAIRGRDVAALRSEALGIIETSSVAAVIEAADAGAKAADVELSTVRLADGLGGKGYLLFSGAVADVEEALDAAVERIEDGGKIIRRELIPQLHPEMAENLGSDLRFMSRVSDRWSEREA